MCSESPFICPTKKNLIIAHKVINPPPHAIDQDELRRWPTLDEVITQDIVITIKKLAASVV